MIIWIIIDKEDGQPIITASSRELADSLMFDYIGYDNSAHEDTVKYFGFKNWLDLEHKDDYIGTYTFSRLINVEDREWKIDKFLLYSKIVNKNSKQKQKKD
jgi:hypothetical protein